MKSEIYSPGQPLKLEDLNYEKHSIRDAIAGRVMLNFSPGVVQDSQEFGELSPFKITSPVGLFINVGSGTAVAGGDVDASDPTATGGESIRIPAAEVATGQNYQRSPGGGPGSGTGTGPFAESSDGLGSFVSTPASTLTRNIPLTDNAVNYVWIGYLRTVDSSVFSLHKATNGKIYPRGTDGYDILVNTSPVTPTFNGNSNYLLLGTATTLGGVVTAISQAAVVFAMVRRHRVGITIDPAASPATYANGETKFLDDHINALGSGPGPSSNNPHNQTVEDFGVAFGDVDLIGHRKNHHTKGIIGTAAALTSSLKPYTDNATPVPFDLGMVFCKQLTAGEEIVLEGYRFSVVGPQLTGPVGLGATGDAYVSFATALAAGTYTIFIKISGGLAVLDKRFGLTVNPNEYFIGTALWNGTAFTSGVPNGVVDGRLFGLTGTKDLQNRSVTNEKLPDSVILENNIAVNAVSSPAIKAADAFGVNQGNITVGYGVKTGHIQDQNITAAKMAPLSIATGSIQNAAVTGAKIATDTITAANIAVHAIESPELGLADNLSLGTGPQDTTVGIGVKTTHIANGAVTAAKLDAALSTSFTAVGSVLLWAGVEASIPVGYLPCDGRPLNAALNTQYLPLFNAIGNTWGGSGFVFNVPDLRGVFVRMVNLTTNGASVAPFWDPNSGPGRFKKDGISPATGVGSYQYGAFETHTHSEVATVNIGGSYDGGGIALNSNQGVASTTGATGGAETRPVNVAMLYIIKY